MTTIIRKFLLSVIIAFTTIFIFCDQDEKSDFYNFKVISTGGGFYGYYQIDGGKTEDFYEAVDASSTSHIAIHEENLNNPSFIYIYVWGEDPDTNSITVQIYVNEIMVKKISDSATTEKPIVSFDVEYNFRESGSSTIK